MVCSNGGLFRTMQGFMLLNTLLYFIEENKMKGIKHPPYSPDLNPIEKVWIWMKVEI